MFYFGIRQEDGTNARFGLCDDGIDHIGIFCGGSAVLEFELTLHEFEFACLKF